MLKNISIDNFGSYQGFYGLEEQDHFKKLNLIYGANYSGKTTLSRIIRCLEQGNLPNNYDNPKFKLSFEENSYHDESTIIGINHEVMVFNKDFINDNLSFLLVNNHHTGSIKSFNAVIIGQDQIEIDQKLNILNVQLNLQTDILEGINQRNNTIDQKIEEIKTTIQKINEDKARKLTNKARSLEELNLLPNQRNYNRAHLATDIERISRIDNYTRRFSELEVLQKLNDINVSKKPLINFVDRSDDIGQSISIHLNEVEKSLNEQVEKISTKTVNQYFKEWIKEGYNLHKEHEQNHCQFCENKLSNELIKNYEDFLNRKDEIFIQDLIKLKEKNNIIIQALDKCLSKFLSGNTYFYDSFIDSCTDKISKINSLLSNITSFFLTINDFIEQKKINIESAIFIDFNDVRDQIYLFIKLYKEYIKVCLDNDIFTNDIEKKQNELRKEVLDEKIIDFLIEVEWLKINENLKNLEKVIDELNLSKKINNDYKEFSQYCVYNINLIISNLVAQKSTKIAAINLINQFLNSFFGHEHLSLISFSNNQDEKDNKFKIVRNGLDAYNLSEGECTLVAFCYFISIVYNLKNTDKLKDYIIYIDDPISSLDSNNIFYIFSLIENVICKKAGYKQMFISTHNLEFFKYIRKLELPIIKVKSCQQVGCASTKKDKREDVGYYFIKKENGISNLVKLPSYLRKYNTEFNYLFSQIWNCSKKDEIEELSVDQIYSLANNMRKFLEVYNYFKYPADNNKSRYREKFLDAGNDMNHFKLIDRIVNEYSHTEEIFERTMRPITSKEMIRAAKFIIERIKELDPDQYDGLVQSINDLKADIS